MDGISRSEPNRETNKDPWKIGKTIGKSMGKISTKYLAGKKQNYIITDDRILYANELLPKFKITDAHNYRNILTWLAKVQGRQGKVL